MDSWLRRMVVLSLLKFPDSCAFSSTAAPFCPMVLMASLLIIPDSCAFCPMVDAKLSARARASLRLTAEPVNGGWLFGACSSDRRTASGLRARRQGEAGGSLIRPVS